MPYYQYSAVDASGRNEQGDIQAPSMVEALQILQQRGLKAPKIVGERQVAAPAQRPAQAPRPAALQIKVPAAPIEQIHRSRKSSDKDIFFLFTQISDQLRAGIGPVQAFGELSRMYKAMKFRESLAMAANAASEGKMVSNVLELWPDLYPEHVVGLVRAGETGGFLPEAALTISEQAHEAHKFKRFHWWIWLLAINAILSLPLVFLFRRWVLQYWEETDKRGGQGDPYALMSQVFIKYLIWPYGPMTLAVIVGLWLARNFLSSRAARTFRHQIGLRMPVLGGRARDESMTVFSWTLAKLSKSGLPPNQAWALAVGSVPNLAMQERLETAGVSMSEGSRLSDVVFKSHLFPQEYAPAVATGELTGDVPGALERLSQISRTEYDAGTVKSKAFTGSIGCTALLVTTGIVTIVIAYALSREIPTKIINSIDNPESPSAGAETP